jgi:hypothetical protein
MCGLVEHRAQQGVATFGQPPASIAIDPGCARFALPKPVRSAILGLETAGVWRMSAYSKAIGQMLSVCGSY